MFIENRSIKLVLIAGFAIAVADIGGFLPKPYEAPPFEYAAGGGPIDVMRLVPREPMQEDEAERLRVVCSVFEVLAGGRDCVAALEALKLEER